MKVVSRLFSFGVILVLGLSCGSIQSLREPAQPDGWMGVPLTGQAVVDNIYQNTHQDMLILTLTQVNLNGHAHTCDVRIEMRSSVHATSTVMVGETVRLTGILTTLSYAGGTQAPSTGTKKPTLPFQAKTYEWLGHITAVQQNSRPLLIRWRDRLLQRAAQSKSVTVQNQTLAQSIVFGASQLDKGTTNEFLAAGLMHVLAASGANILLIQSFLERTIYPIWRLLRLPHRGFVLLMAVCVWVFCLMCGGQASILRAAVMSTVRLLGIATGRGSTMRMSLAVAACMMSILSPSSMIGPSAWLSFMATGALSSQLLQFRQKKLPPSDSLSGDVGRGGTVVWVWVWVRRVVVRFVQRLFQVIRVTLWIEVWVTPLTLWMFAQITPYSLISNVVCDGLLALLLPFIVVWLIFANVAVWMPSTKVVEEFLGIGVNNLLTSLHFIVSVISRFPHALIETSVVPVSLLLFYYAILLGGIALHRRYTRR